MRIAVADDGSPRSKANPTELQSALSTYTRRSNLSYNWKDKTLLTSHVVATSVLLDQTTTFLIWTGLDITHPDFLSQNILCCLVFSRLPSRLSCSFFLCLTLLVLQMLGTAEAFMI